MIAACVVVYRPELQALQSGLQAIADANQQGLPIDVHLWHNDEGPEATPGLPALLGTLRQHGLNVAVRGGRGNLGFGCANNLLVQHLPVPSEGYEGHSFVLLLNQDAIPEPGALRRLWQTALQDEVRVAAWEMRQIPYEHPKDYDPVTGETGWCSGAALLLRTDALRAVGGFEPRFFMYCEDVDLSWRLRCAGWRLRYVPQCAAVHRTYSRPAELKPLMVTEGRYANLCLRTRFAGRRQVLEGVRSVLAELRQPPAFEGHHRGLRRALLKFARNYSYFRRTRSSGPDFEPLFAGWDYEMRREGAFHPFLAQDERTTGLPPVSVLLRTSARGGHLHDRLRCLAGQTHKPAEVVVVEPASPAAVGSAIEPMLSAWSDRLNLLHLRVPAATPLADLVRLWTTSEWLLVLDDEELRLYADHIEVLAQAAQPENADGAYSLGWQMHASADDAARVHRLHGARTRLGAEPGQRPAMLWQRRLLLESEAGADRGGARIVEVDRLTWLRYEPAASAAGTSPNSEAAASR